MFSGDIFDIWQWALTVTFPLNQSLGMAATSRNGFINGYEWVLTVTCFIQYHLFQNRNMFPYFRHISTFTWYFQMIFVDDIYVIFPHISNSTCHVSSGIRGGPGPHPCWSALGRQAAWAKMGGFIERTALFWVLNIPFSPDVYPLVN